MVLLGRSGGAELWPSVIPVTGGVIASSGGGAANSPGAYAQPQEEDWLLEDEAHTQLCSPKEEEYREGEARSYD